MSDTKAVYKAINKVSGLLAKEGISKNRENNMQHYKFRGIDDVYNALAPFLSESGLCILPRVMSRDVVERETKNKTALFYVTVKVEFDFVSAEDGSVHMVSTFGEAMDSADKATNKAMSAAYKYACMQAFCIPTEGDNDADSTTHEVRAKALPAPHKPVDGAMESLSDEKKAEIQDIALDVITMVADGRTALANEYITNQNLEVDEKVALWSLLKSDVRSALKKAQALSKGVV